MLLVGPATILLVFGARLILRVYGGSYVAHTVVLSQLLALTLLPFCIETIAFSLDGIAGKPIRATLSQLAIAVITLGGSWLLFGRLGLNGVGVACLVADTAVALVRLPTVLAALRRRPGGMAQPASAPQQAAMRGSRTRARPRRPSNRRSYAGRHRHYVIAEKLRSGSADAEAELSRQGRQAVAGDLQVKEVRIDDADDRFVIRNPDDLDSA